MPRFSYKAKAGVGQTVIGTIDAATLREAIEKLSRRGEVPLEVSPLSVEDARRERRVNRMDPPFVGRTIHLRDLCDLTRRLFDLLDAGVPILRSFEVLNRHVSPPRLKGIVVAMIANLQAGESLSTALARFPAVFPSFYVHMVRSGEAAGDLAGALGRLVELIERDLKMRGKVAGSLAYPAIVMGTGVLTFVVLLTVVMPKLVVLFEDFDAALPWPTRLVMSASDIFARFWWLIAGILIGVCLLGFHYVRTPRGRALLDGTVLRVPLLAVFVRQTETARMARTLAILLQGGVPIASALEMVAGLANNSGIRAELVQVARDVREGQSFTAAVRNNGKQWPEVTESMIAVGEESGHLEKALVKLAAVLEREIEGTAGMFVTLLGPAVLFIVVGLVGAMILAVMLPLFQMNTIMR